MHPILYNGCMRGEITRKFLAKLVNRTEHAVKSYFSRNNISKDNPDDVREYLKRYLCNKK